MATAHDVTDRSRDADRRLVHAIVSGDLAAWHAFVARYSPVLYHTLRKHMIAEDEDDVRTLYVDVLHHLYHGKLAQFEGRASLSTWLVLVARNVAFDRLRHWHGRPRERVGLKRLTALEREVHRLWIVEGLSFAFVRRLARPGGPPLESQELLDAIARIREVAETDASARPRHEIGLPGSPRVPRREYADHLRWLQAELEEARSPEAEMVRRETGHTIEWLARRLEQLPREDRELLRLRFEERLTARSIARRLGAPSARPIFTWVGRLLSELRSELKRQFP